MKRQWTSFIALGALALAGCQEGTVLGTVDEDDRSDIVAELEASGFMGEEFGEEGVSASTSVVAAAYFEGDGVAGPDRPDSDAPQAWGRKLGRPVRRNIEIQVEGNVATVTKAIAFEGEFLLRNPDADAPVSKPANHTMLQSAQLERLERDEVDEKTGRHRRWKLTHLSAQEWVMTDADQRTVSIERIEIFLNGESVAVVEDPATLYEVTGRIPVLREGAEVKVSAAVKNYTSDREGNSATWVFLHVFHADRDSRRWGRLPMMFNEDTRMYERTWVVRQAGRERIVVDAIDADSFALDRDDNYRANLWGVPYRIEDGVTDR